MQSDASFHGLTSRWDYIVGEKTFIDEVIRMAGGIPNADGVGMVRGSEGNKVLHKIFRAKIASTQITRSDNVYGNVTGNAPDAWIFPASTSANASRMGGLNP